mmetsp:Transcript_22915/g.52523  ORF Transcript_22915/g.52523 Transcript_22915/m.52523 type:complete len:193 (+) Transcript_22915:87-665(+)
MATSASKAAPAKTSASDAERPATAAQKAQASDEKAAMAKKVTAIFKRFDKDGSGTISKDELTKVLKSLDYKTFGGLDGEKKINTVMRMADTNRDGQINYEEFMNWISANGKNAQIVLEKATAPTGPEKFFYDHSTYTGVHTHGGPSVDDRDGKDFSQVTRAGINHGGNMQTGHTEVLDNAKTSGLETSGLKK